MAGLPPSMGRMAFYKSKNLKEASQRSYKLYEKYLKSSKQITEMYQLEYTPREVRARIKEEWLKNKDLTDPKLIDILVFRGNIQLQEILLLHKGKSHLLKYMNPPTVGDHQEEVFEKNLKEMKLLQYGEESEEKPMEERKIISF